MEEFISLKISSLSRDEVLKSLGYTGQKLSVELIEKIDRHIEEVLRLADIRAVFMTGTISENSEPTLLDIPLLGNSIKDHLKDSVQVAVFAITLGSEIDRRIKRYSLSEVDSAYIMDTIASILIEKGCDEISERFESEMKEKGLYTTERFSPGYADLPLSLQSVILNRLDTPRRIGLSVSKHNLLIPRKSVTAFIGVLKKPRTQKSNRCATCIRRGRCKYGICFYE